MTFDRETFDLIVIGGGINGAAITREAALHGLRVLLLERDDFCSGTSAASTRLIHGGLRYLEHAEFSLVRESLHERERLLSTAPHLVEPLEIFLPLTRQSRRGRWTIRAGLTLYDLLSFGKSLPRHRMHGREAMLAALPGLNPDALLGGASYYDAQVRYPERLVLENALDAQSAGATLANHTEATQLIVEHGRVSGVAWQSGNRTGVAHAAVVVNAAGPWVDSVLGALGCERLIGGTRGSHLIATPFAGAPLQAIYAEARSDGRPFFIIPWNDLYLIGTTDERDPGDPTAATISASEFDYLVAETQQLFPAATDLAGRICYTYAGIRPLPNVQTGTTGAITRRHLVHAQPGVAGLYSIVGGKLTTHRALAADCLRQLRKELPVTGPSPTLDRPLPGALAPVEREELIAELAAAFGPVTASRLWRTYGAAALQLAATARQDRELGQRAGPDAEMLVAEIAHAFAQEGAGTLTDLLQRRSMLGLAADFGLRLAPLAADWMVRLGIRNKSQAAAELADYRQYARRFTRRSAAIDGLEA